MGRGDASQTALPEDALLRSLFELLPAGVLVLQEAGRLAWWNPAAQATWPVPLLAGRSLELPPGTSWGSGGEVLSEGWAGLRAARDGERVVGQVLWMPSAGGSRRLVVHSAVPVPSAGGGTPAGAVVLIQDVTEIKAVEGQLEALLASMGEALVCVDAQLRISRVNRSAEQLFGHPASRLEGADVSVLLEPGGRPDARAALAGAAPSPSATRLPGCWRRAGGEPLQLEATASAFRWDGQLLRTILLRDVSSQLRTESTQRLLAEVSDLLSSTLDERSAAQDVTRVATAFGHADLALLHVRREDGHFERLALSAGTGLASDVQLLAEALPAEDDVTLAPGLYRDGEPLLLPALDRAELAARLPSQRIRGTLERWGIRSLLALPLQARGRTHGGLLLFRAKGRYVPADLDWGRLLATRAALALDNAALFEAAQAAGRERAALLGVVAHELRNPLSTVRMAAGLVRRALPARPEVAARAAEMSERAAVRADGILQALLDGARSDAGKLELRCAPLSVEGLLPEIRALGDGLSGDARLEVRAASGLPRILGDATRLMQILGNLLGNAFRHSPRGGTVTLDISAVEGGLEFRVRDEGPGLSAQDWAHLFERGWRGSGNGSGLGLGLYLSRVLVEAQGGEIWAERPEGRGAVFGFRLPLAPAEIPAGGRLC